MTSHCLQFLKQFEMKLMRENVLKVSRQLLKMILYEYDAIRLRNVCTRIRVCESDHHWRRGACPKLTFTRQIRRHISQMTARWTAVLPNPLRIKATHQGQKIGILSFISALLSINYTKSLLPGCRALCVKVGGWTDCWQTDRVEGDRVRGLINQLSAISLPAIGYQLHSGRGWK